MMIQKNWSRGSKTFSKKKQNSIVDEACGLIPVK